MTLVDIDAAVTRVAKRYFPELWVNNQDPRVTLQHQDGSVWTQAQPTAALDVIIVDYTDPIGPGERLFTTAFYQECARVLRPEGLIVQQIASPLAHMPLMQCIYQRLRTAGLVQRTPLSFPQLEYCTGWWAAVLAGRQAYQVRQSALQQKPFQTRYYNAAMHQAALAQPEFRRFPNSFIPPERVFLPLFCVVEIRA